MITGSALRAGLLAAAGMAVLAAAWLAVSALAIDDRIREASATQGAALPVLRIERDLAKLDAALADDDSAIAARHFGAMRAALTDSLDSEAALRSLDAVETAQLSRIAREFERILTPETPGLRAILREHAEALGRLSARLTGREGDAMADLRALQQRRAEMTVLVVILVALAAALLGVTALLHRELRRGSALAGVALQQQAADEAARIAQARMRAMLSGELRVPLNGLLGLIGVMREAVPPPTIAPLVDQLERSARHLLAMLQDMIAEPQNEAEAEAPQAARTFCPGDIAGAISDIYGPIAASRGTRFTVTTADDMPGELCGDGVRMQRAITQLCSGVLAADGVDDVELALSHEAGETRAALSFAHADGEEAALRVVQGEGDEEGLGTLLARGLMEQLGGRLEVATLESGRVLVLAAAPGEPVPEARPRVRIVARTRSVGALGTAAVGAAGVDVVAISSAPEPDVVLLEAGGADEASSVAEIRSRWPGARLIALGTPDDPGAFDSIIPPPLQPARVSAAVGEAWRSCQDGLKPVMQAQVALDPDQTSKANGDGGSRRRAV